MRDVGRAHLPDACADPAKRGEDHVDDRPNHKHLKSAVPIAQLAEEHTKDAVAETKDEPGDQAGSQEIARSAHKAKNGNSSKKTKNRSRGYIALESKTLEQRNMIGNHQPSKENQSEAVADVHTCADRGVAKELKPTIAGQM